jgi:hypothetical protein
MKNLVIVLSVLFLFSLTSCSDINDNSLLTNPVLEKSSLPSNEEITPSPVYPYPYLHNFSKVEGLTYLTLEGENAIEFYIPEGTEKFAHMFIVVNFVQGIGLPIAPKMYFIDQITETSFKVEGIKLDQVQKLSVYGFELNGASEGIYPFVNNSNMQDVAVKGWKLGKNNIKVECSGIWPSSLKFIFAEINSKAGSYLVFLQRPYSTTFEIPEYGKFGVAGLQLFGYQTVMEGDVASF